MTETDVQNTIRIEGAKIRMILWRNNSGALQDVKGRLRLLCDMLGGRVATI